MNEQTLAPAQSTLPYELQQFVSREVALQMQAQAKVEKEETPWVNTFWGQVTLGIVTAALTAFVTSRLLKRK